MKKIITYVLLLLISSLHAQSGKVNYGYINSKISGNATGLDYNAILLFNTTESYYVTRKDSLEQILDLEQDKVVKNTIIKGKGLSALGNQVYIDFYQDSLWANEKVSGKQMFMKEKKPIISWKITTETKKIGEFTCTKATTSFRGRDYTAWFTSEIPVKYGPWKLQGLPGLILEAYDKDKYVYWYFKNVTYGAAENTVVNQFKYDPDTKFSDSWKKSQQEKYDLQQEHVLIIAKRMPTGITVSVPKMSMMFIECEE